MTSEQKALVEEYRQSLLGLGSPLVPDSEYKADFTCRDEQIPRRWREGDCHILSVAMYAATGWEPLGLYDTRIGGGPEGDGSGGFMVHSLVVSPDKLWVADGHGWTPNTKRDMSRLARSYGVQSWSEAWCTCLPSVLEEGVAPVHAEDEYRARCHATIPVAAHLLRSAPANVISWLKEPGHWDLEREQRRREWEAEARLFQGAFEEEECERKALPAKRVDSLIHFGEEVALALREVTAAWARSRTQTRGAKRPL